MAEQELDRNEAATPYKLEKARERGQVPKSVDIVSVTVFTVAMIFLNWKGWDAWRDLFRLDAAVLVQAAHLDPSPAGLWALVSSVVHAALSMAVPFFIALLLAAVAGNVLQTGPVFSFQSIKADWSRINPVTGFKRFFTVRTLFHGARSILKLAVLAWMVYLALRALVPHFYMLSGLPPAGMLRTLLSDIAGLGLRLAVVLWLIAIVDLVHSRRTFAKDMRMSRRELKEEVKHREGDPRIRARQRELRREMLRRVLALKKTKDASVLVTNPTHYAVALRYVHGEMAAPRLLAKGSGPLAALMRKIAARHRIPVVQNPSLARRLYRELPVDGSVPPDLYAQVARIIVWVFALRDASRAPAPSPGGGPPREVAWGS
jgi:flagellar biosynthetic protein FlhB